VRNGGDDGKLPEPWVFDISRPGNVCVRDGTPVVFLAAGGDHRAQSHGLPDRQELEAGDGVAGRRGPHDPAGPLQRRANRATYLVDLGPAHAAVTLNIIPGAASTDAMQAAWMIEKGCQAQAEGAARQAALRALAQRRRGDGGQRARPAVSRNGD